MTRMQKTFQTLVALYFVSVFPSSIGLTFTHSSLREEICGAPGYDTSNLTRADYWMFENSGHCLENSTSCQYMMSFCKPLVVSKFATANCSHASVCQKLESGQERKLSTYTMENPFHVNNTLYNGFGVTFKNGSTYKTTEGKPCNISVMITFECNASAIWTPIVKSNEITASPVPVPVDVHYFPSTCLYMFRMDYEGACHKITPANPVGEPSAGTVIIIIFAISCTIYFVGGILVNALRGEKGVDLLPNSDFWKQLPGWIKDGWEYTVQCKGCRETSGGGYESI